MPAALQTERSFERISQIPHPPAGTGLDLDCLLIERGEEDSIVARRIRERLPEIPVRIIDDVRADVPRDFSAGKRVLAVQRHRGTFLQHCPAGTTGMVCCNYLV